MKENIIVAGASGIVGRGFIEYISRHNPNDYGIIGLSRREPDRAFRERVAHICNFFSVDLNDQSSITSLSGHAADATRLIYAAVQESSDLVSGWRDTNHVSTNLRMFSNLMHTLGDIAPKLRHVTLLQGTKAYGAHHGGFTIPARESDPEYLPSNFYYEQARLLKRMAKAQPWAWTILRPQLVLGFAPGSSMNLLGAIAAYAMISKYLGLPLRFPGKNLKRLWQAVDANILAQAMLWAGSAQQAHDSVYNLTNGDCWRWETMWPAIARWMGMDEALPHTLRLRHVMPDKASIWRELAQDYGLLYADLEQIASWHYADFMLNAQDDSVVSDILLHSAGFVQFIDTEKSISQQLERLVEHRIIPAPDSIQ